MIASDDLGEVCIAEQVVAEWRALVDEVQPGVTDARAVLASGVVVAPRPASQVWLRRVRAERRARYEEHAMDEGTWYASLGPVASPVALVAVRSDKSGRRIVVGLRRLDDGDRAYLRALIALRGHDRTFREAPPAPRPSPRRRRR